MRATEVLREEHDAVLVVLDALEQAVTAAEHGRSVPKSIFQDIEEFFTVFVERCHHGKESTTVFSQLNAAPGNAGLIEQLETEHETGKRLSAAYREALRLRPLDARPHNGLGSALDDAGRLSDAVAEYELALRLDPRLVEGHIILGTARA